ncbi:hypothetical protein K492DRAFT_192699 [Lichtheimia hyalospora FSU 10163]|nr:hypothetical protein K492DRAFT_192699 [Lichtheimia hyalospora FSU 10163]
MSENPQRNSFTGTSSFFLAYDDGYATHPQELEFDPYAENDRQQQRTMDSVYISEYQEQTQMSIANTAPLMAFQNNVVPPSTPRHILDPTIALDTIDLPDDYIIASAQPVPSLSPSPMGEQHVFLSGLESPLHWDALSLPVVSSPSSVPITPSQQSSFSSSIMTSAPNSMVAAALPCTTIPLPTTSSQLFYSSRDQQQHLSQPTTSQNLVSNDNTAVVSRHHGLESCSSPVASTPSSERGSYMCRVSHNCRATFTRRSDRDRHELIHKPPRTLYTCEYCNITCTRKDTLKRHQARSCPVINACKHQSSSTHASRG